MIIKNFFTKKNQKINKLFPKKNFKKNFEISHVRPLDKAEKNDLTFFDSIKYSKLALKTKASICITTQKLSHFLPKATELISLKMFYLSWQEFLK